MMTDLVKVGCIVSLILIAAGAVINAERSSASAPSTVYVHMDRGTALNILQGLDEGTLGDGAAENLRTYLRAAVAGEQSPPAITPQQQADAQRLRAFAGEPLVPAVIRAELAQIAARLEGGLIQ